MKLEILVSAVLLAGGLVFAQSDLSADQPTDASTEASQPAEGSPGAIVDEQMEGMSEWVSDAAAEERMLELMGQGKYVRKSLMVLPTLFWIGDGPNPIKARQRNLIIGALRDSLAHMARFDINPAPARATLNMFRSWNNAVYSNPSQAAKMAKLGELINDNLTPDLLGFMASVMKERAERNITEDQANSFMVDKAKESGVTAAELNLALNSGYVIVPTMTYKAHGYRDDGSIEATLRGGLILYKVRVDKDRTWLEKKAMLVRVGQSSVDKEGYTVLQIASMNPAWAGLSTAEVVFNMAVNHMMSGVMQDMRDQKEFRLVTQMTWAEKSEYHLPFSPTEIKDVPMDKFFENVEQVEDKDGSIKEEVTGWGFVYKPTNFKSPVRKLDSNITEYTWQAYAPKGSPMAGSIAREYSRVPVDVDFRVGTSLVGVTIPAGGMRDEFGNILLATSLSANDTSIAGMGTLLQVQSSYGPIAGISQFSLRLSASLGMVFIDSSMGMAMDLGLSSPYIVDGIWAYDVGLGVQKKWWMGQVVPMAGVDLRYGQVAVFGSQSSPIDSDEEFGELKAYYLGARANVGVEFAFTPNIRLGVFGAGTFNVTMPSWEYKVGDDEGSFELATDSESAGLNPVGFEAGVQLMVNAWPLRKLWDKGMEMSTTGAGGVVRQANLRPID